jgi:hypothetical protein
LVGKCGEGNAQLTPSEFATEIVVPTVREFRDDRRSRRRAYLACMVTYHLKDYLQKSDVDVEAAMKTFGGSRAFEVVRAVCTAAKHKVFAGDKHPDNIPFSAGDDYDRPPATWDEAVWDLSRWGDAVGGREIAQNLGGLDLYECVKTVLKTYEFHFDFLLHDVDFHDC